MRIIPLVLACCFFVAAPFTTFAAGSTSVRAIAFIASHKAGPSDPQLAPYEGTLRANLRFESFRYAGESSATVSAGGTAAISVNGMQIQLSADPAGHVNVRRGGTVVTVSPGRPAVFMGRPAGAGEVSGVIVMAD